MCTTCLVRSHDVLAAARRRWCSELLSVSSRRCSGAIVRERCAGRVHVAARLVSIVLVVTWCGSNPGEGSLAVHESPSSATAAPASSTSTPQCVGRARRLDSLARVPGSATALSRAMRLSVAAGVGVMLTEAAEVSRTCASEGGSGVGAVKRLRAASGGPIHGGRRQADPGTVLRPEGA